MSVEPIESWVDVVAAVLLVAGGILSLAAGVGLVRFRDPLSRMHAATKPQVLGLICILAAVALTAGNWRTLLIIAPAILLQLLTSPMAAHMIGRSAYRTGTYSEDELFSDELRDDIERATRTAPEVAAASEAYSQGQDGSGTSIEDERP